MTARKKLDDLTSNDLDQLYAELDALRAIARGYCPACGRGDAAPTVDDWQRERQRAETAEAKVLDYENRITWHTTCASCARILDSSIRETERRERAEAAIDRVCEAAQWLRRNYPGLTQLHTRLDAALDEPAPAHGVGPTVREAARDDRAHWTAKYAGEGQ
jgi:hypothetical protein